MSLDDLYDLNGAAAELGLEPVTLRAAIARGRLRARKFGNSWITTRDEIDRYRRENLGRPGRRIDPQLRATIPWPTSAWGPLRILGSTETPLEVIEAVVDVALEAIHEGAQSAGQIRVALKSDPRTSELILGSGELPPFIGIGWIAENEGGPDDPGAELLLERD